MSNLITFRQSVADAIKVSVTEAAAVHTHGGRFSKDDLDRYALKAPCIVVGITGVRQLDEDGGQAVAHLELVAVIVTIDKPKVDRDIGAIGLLQSTLAVVKPSQRFGDENAHPPEAIRGENLFTGKVDKLGVAMWAVTWRQKYDINVFDPNSLPDFLRYRGDIAVEDAELGDESPVMEVTLDREAQEDFAT